MTALSALSKLVANDGHKSSMYQEFDQELRVQNKQKKLSEFKERRFALVGYTAAAIIHHLPEYISILEKPKSNNLLVQACSLYLNVEYIIIALKCLAFFSKKVTLPFLNMCELKTQKDLVDILPKLKDDLASSKMDTLCEFEVDYSFQPDSPLSQYILKGFCEKAAINLTNQRGREYGFADGEAEKEPRATVLSQIDRAALEGLPTNNLECERDLAKFDHLARRSAACSNKRFTAKGIRDEMTLYQARCVKIIDKGIRNIAKLLDVEEKKWVQSQQLLTEQKLKENAAKASHRVEYVHVLLAKCKKHGGPFVSVQELESHLKELRNEADVKKMLREEISYRRHISTRDFQERPQLYRVNQISVIEMKVNLGVLLTNAEIDVEETTTLPSEEEIMNTLVGEDITCQIPHSGNAGHQESMNANHTDPGNSAAADNTFSEPVINEPCIVIWDEASDRKWYLAMCRSKLDHEKFLVDHLECVSKNGIKHHWRYPTKSDEQEVELDQIIPCNIIGAWNLQGRSFTFELDNWHVIDGIFQAMYKI